MTTTPCDRRYFRPLVQSGPVRPEAALPLCGGRLWFTHVEELSRDKPAQILPAQSLEEPHLLALTAPRPPILGMMMDEPRVMGILNTTPDSFSDGGLHHTAARAAVHGEAMAEAGAAIIDVGGESTRPGAPEVPAYAEIARVEPAIVALVPRISAPISIDTRKRAVAEAAVAAGAAMVNDVSGFKFDPDLASFCADHHLPVCIMHSPDVPERMQAHTDYANLLLDIYDFLGTQMSALAQKGISRARMVIDPGLGFGKTQLQNLALLRNLSLFHGLGAPILIGGSRKRFVREISGAESSAAAVAGSVGMALAAAAQGAQILRVHDVPETVQALKVWRAIEGGQADDT